jgi:hypothetical protein
MASDLTGKVILLPTPVVKRFGRVGHADVNRLAVDGWSTSL